MAKVAIVSGLLLVVLGLYSYFVVSSVSVTALIPAFLGLPVLILGIVALNEKYLKHTMHVAAMLMVIGFVGAIIRSAPKLLAGEMTAAVTAQILMAFICFVFTVLAVKSFIDVRKARENSEKGKS